ncbi:hypothetical protein QCA50_007023 [Cerrena zonata]|uniref:GSKIP domain-containing protein n=1 Tax=Cerrena zonata TaxID=2478898 RepID=A0AAW0GAG4_9APHY
MATPQSHPSNFTHSELERALSEQSFGITSYEIISSSELEASARVVLLEGSVIVVSLTSRGYQIVPSSKTDEIEAGLPDDVFEEVDILLQAISERYRQARQMALMEKLALLSDRAES